MSRSAFGRRAVMAGAAALAVLAGAGIALRRRRGPITAQGWRDDLQTFARELPRRHPRPFGHIGAVDFERHVAALDARIPELTNVGVVLALAALVAEVGDGHTSTSPDDQQATVFRYLPLHLWMFEGDTYLIAADEPRARWLGRRLVRIGRTPANEACARIAAVISRDNEMELTYTVPDYLIRPEVLSGLGIVDDTARIELAFEGEVDPLVHGPIASADYDAITWHAARAGVAPARDVTLSSLFSTALDRAHAVARDWHWWSPLDADGAVYFRYDRCFEQKGRAPVASVVESLLAALDARPEARLVVDLRQNSGGDAPILAPLLAGIASRERFSARGSVVVLVGRRTFSAALTNTIDLRRRAGAVVVGEHPRGKPNSPSEGRDLVLPNSNMVVSISSQLVVRDETLGDQPFLPLDVEVVPTIADYRAGGDATLAAALRVPRAPPG